MFIITELHYTELMHVYRLHNFISNYIFGVSLSTEYTKILAIEVYDCLRIPCTTVMIMFVLSDNE